MLTVEVIPVLNIDDSFNGWSASYSSSSTSINDIDDLANPLNYPTLPRLE